MNGEQNNMIELQMTINVIFYRSHRISLTPLISKNSWEIPLTKTFASHEFISIDLFGMPLFSVEAANRQRNWFQIYTQRTSFGVNNIEDTQQSLFCLFGFWKIEQQQQHSKHTDTLTHHMFAVKMKNASI